MTQDQTFQKDLSLPMGKAGLVTLPFAIAALLLFIPAWFTLGGSEIKEAANFLFSIWVFIPVMLVGIVIHELIHGVIWALFAPGGWKSISFGVQWKTLTPYAHCNEALSVRDYILGAAMPGVLLGLLPFVFGLLFGSAVATLFGVVFTSVACGDAWVIWSLRGEQMNALVKDHPTNAGCIVSTNPNATA